MVGLEEIGTRIASARKDRYLRQADLAARAGVSRATIAALENGRASDLGYSRLARILGVLGLELKIGPVTGARPTLDELLMEREPRD